MMKTFACLLLILFLGSCSDKTTQDKVSDFELRLAESESGPDLKEMIYPPSGQRFFIHDSVILSNADLFSAEVIDAENRPKVLVKLNRQGSQKFSDFTRENIGKNAAMLVDRKLVCAPLIKAEIKEGVLLITGVFSQKEASGIAESIITIKSQ